MKKILIYLNCVFLLFLLSSCGLFNFTTPPKSVYISDYWSLLAQGDKIYISSFPITSNTITKYRNLHYLMLVYDKNQKNYIVSIVGGKSYDSFYEVILKVNYNEYYLPVYNDRAWLTSKQKVYSLIEDMKLSSELILVSTFEDKTQAIDTYSLKGFNETINLINK